MPRVKGLTELQLSAAELIAKGKTENEVAEECSRSREWVAQLKRKPEFQEAVEEFKRVIKNNKKAQLDASNIPEIQDFRQKTIQAAQLIHDTAIALLLKVQQKVEEMEVEEIKGDRIGQALKQVADSITVSSDLYKQVLGIDQLIEELESVTKASGFSTVEPAEGE